MNNAKLIIYKEDDNTDVKTLTSNIYETSSQAVYRISPILVKEESGNNYCLLKTNKETSSKLNNLKTEMYWDKFTNKDSEIEATNIIDEIIEPIELKQTEDEDEPRKFLDRDNLVKAFLFSFDPLSNRLTGYSEEEQNTEDIKFEHISNRLGNLFNIKSS
jgi:hypothetical protein